MGFAELVVALVLIGGVLYTVNQALKKPEPPRIHECTQMGHDYQPAYDETTTGDMNFPIPQAGPFMSEHSVVSIVREAAKAVPKNRTYVHSVCRYCGLTVDRPEKK